MAMHIVIEAFDTAGLPTDFVLLFVFGVVLASLVYQYLLIAVEQEHSESQQKDHASIASGSRARLRRPLDLTEVYASASRPRRKNSAAVRTPKRQRIQQNMG